MSVGSWVKTSNTSTQIILGKGIGSTQYAYSLLTASGIPSFYLYNTANTSYIDASANTSVADNNWHHIVGSYDGTTASIYIDGILQSSSTTKTGSQVTDSTSPFEIGARNATTLMYSGTIDEPFVTAEALTASQVKRMYETGKRALASHSANDYQNELAEDTSGTGAINNVAGVAVDWNNEFAYIAMEDGDGDGDVGSVKLT